MPGTSSVEEGATTVVVTGAAGFLGSRVVELLSAGGRHQVLATDVVDSDRAAALGALPAVTFRTADLRDSAAIEEMVAGSDAVVHLAAVRMKASADRPRDAHDINVGATYDLMSLAVRHAIRRFVFGSSHMVYGPFADPDAPPYLEEQAAIRPGLSMYAASKLAAEAFLSAFAATDGLDYYSLRFGTIYGPRVNADSNGGILLAAIDALGKGERPVIPWTRDSVHGLTFVDDAARATVLALDATPSGVPVNVVGEPVSAETMYTALVKLCGGDPSALDWRDERTRYQLVNSDRLRTVLGLEHRTNLEDGLTALIDWYRAGRA